MDGTGQVVSPKISNASRLVVSSFRFLHALNKRSANCAQAKIKCSQLSSTIKDCFDPKCFTSVSIIGWFDSSRAPAAFATSCPTSNGSLNPPRSTHHTPSLNLLNSLFED